MSGNDERVAELFAAAISLEPDEQPIFLVSACEGQPHLLAAVQALLAADREAVAGGFMHEPALNLQASHFARQLEDSRTGERVGHYEILSLVGEGGMGEVYLARDLEFDRKVALKLVKGGLKTKAILRRFHNERQILANLQHTNIARLLDGGTSQDGLPYFAMEYIEGQPITDYAAAHQLTLRQRLDLFRTVCSAVQFAHQNLIIHRDIKPSNILVTEDGTPKLLDFGIAKLLDAEGEEAELTATAVRVMTPEYASPEQVKGEPLTTASDVYALGVLLYELLTGRRPYRVKSRTVEEAAKAICEQLPERPSGAATRRDPQAGSPDTETPSNGASVAAAPRLPVAASQLKGDLDNIVLMALRKEPARRYPSVSEFAEDISRHLDGLPVRARKDTFGYRASKFVRRNKVPVAAATVVLLTLIAGVVAIAWEAHVARRERARAERRFNDVRRMADSFMFELNDEIQKGPTKAREMLVKKALEYLDSLAQEAGNDRSLQQQLATAYERVGDIQGQPYKANLGDTAGALASYQKAQAILEALSASEPKNLDALKSLCLVYQKTGLLQSRAGDTKAAVESGRGAVAKADLLVASAPTNTEYLSLLSGGYISFGNAIWRDGQSDSVTEIRKALENFRKGLAIDEELLAADPTNVEKSCAVMRDNDYVGYCLWQIGDLQDGAESYRAAFDYFRKNKDIAEALYANEPNRFRRERADVIMSFGAEQQRLGDATAALASYQQGLALFEQIAVNDPNNIEARRDLADSYRNIGDAFMKTGDLNSALTYSRKALAIYEALQKLDANSAQNQYYVMMLPNQVGELLCKMKRWSEAQPYFFKALAVLENVSKGDSSRALLSQEQMRRLIAIVDMDIAKGYEGVAADTRASATKRRADWQQARDWYQKSRAIWQQIQADGVFSQGDSAKADETAVGIARCDAALHR